ncbi:hypothetical protein ACQPWR_29600 [Micromonospora vinacea]|uniref:hypothetical protein n=1 Tax=Micromonospora vinacea TaxID=709878 RepID=UPI003D913DA5
MADSLALLPNLLDNITLYWLTGAGASSARWYWVPVGFTTFPGETWAAPRSWAEAVYPGLSYFDEAERGGHFAAWEESELFSAEVRAAFRPLRIS